MTILDFSRGAFGICAAAAMLVGCGSPAPIGAPGATTQSQASATHASRGSWMLPEANGRDLLYVSNGFTVYVYTYPNAKLLGTIAPFQDTSGECAEKAGNVFIADYYYGAYEYAHGGTMPIASLYNQAGRSIGCSVDPTTGNLAISGGSPGGSVVTIFTYNRKRGWRYPKFYSDATFEYGDWCGYDSKGNLYIDGLPSSSGSFQLAELPKGGSRLVNITLNQEVHSPGGVQWDGKRMTVGDSGVQPPVVYQFTVSGSVGTVVGSTTLDSSQTIHQYWIQGNRLIGPSYLGNNIGFWHYPGGGNPAMNVALGNASAATVSLAPK